jgi:hypothetical protein
MPHGAPSIWDHSISLDEFERRVRAHRRTQSARTSSAGAAVRAEALAVIGICTEYGRPDLMHQVIGMSPAEARKFVIDQIWTDAFAKARATPSWMVR